MNPREQCALMGCSKASAFKEQPACGELHHLLIMAGRYKSAPLHPYQSIQDRNAMGLCALESCSTAPSPGHSWCSRTHYLAWLSSFYAALSPFQICKLPSCNRHVYVSDTDGVPPSQFCGWRHCQKFAILSGIQQQQQQDPNFVQSECGHVAPMKSFLRAFEHFVLNGITPKSIKVDDEFFCKHPWEVLAEGDTCYVIARCKFTCRRKNKQRDMVTKGHYHWKQQGPPKEKSGYWRKYFSYMKLKGKEEEAAQHYDGMYTMKEYIMDSVDSYSLVKLRKGGKKVGKGRKRRKLDDDIVLCFQESASPKLDDDTWCFQEHVNRKLDSWSDLEELFCADYFDDDAPSMGAGSYDNLCQFSAGLSKAFCPTSGSRTL